MGLISLLQIIIIIRKNTILASHFCSFGHKVIVHSFQWKIKSDNMKTQTFLANKRSFRNKTIDYHEINILLSNFIFLAQFCCQNLFSCVHVVIPCFSIANKHIRYTVCWSTNWCYIIPIWLFPKKRGYKIAQIVRSILTNLFR